MGVISKRLNLTSARNIKNINLVIEFKNVGLGDGFTMELRDVPVFSAREPEKVSTYRAIGSEEDKI